MATIAVEIPAASAAPEQAEALLRACTIAAAPDRCETAGASSEPATAFAVVTWTGELTVKVEIGQSGAEDWIERRLTFAPEDPSIERWQAVGFAIGTLVGAAREEQAPAATEVPAPTPPPSVAEPNSATEAVKTPQGHAVRLDLLGRVGTGTESSARFGAGLAVTARHGSGPFGSLEVSADLADAAVGMPTSALAVRFLTVGASAGAAISLSESFQLDLSAGPLLEYQWLWTDRTQGTQSRLLGGVRAIFGVRHRVGSHVWLGVSTQMGARFGDTTITIDGERVDNVPLVFATAALSVGFDLWQR